MPIGNVKITRTGQFHPSALVIKYHQKTYNGCCLSSLEKAFHCIGDNSDVPFLVNSIEESLTLQTENYNIIIHFVNAIMTKIRKIEGEHNLQYNLTIWKKNDAIDILNDISAYVSLVHLMDSLVNVNRDISIVGHWIFDSKNNKALYLTQ